MIRVAAAAIDCSTPQSAWEALSATPRCDVLVLPELVFMPWFCARRKVDPELWAQACHSQREWLTRLGELPADVVIGTAPREVPEPVNDAFVWTRPSGFRWSHRKTYLPDEPGFWEASWYRRGPVEFLPVDTSPARLGIAICTELWFVGQDEYPDVDLLVSPRTTPAETAAKWVAGGQAAAVRTGAYSVSANRAGEDHGVEMGATAWITDPDGTVLAVSPGVGFAVADVDLDLARAAKGTYPRYVDRS